MKPNWALWKTNLQSGKPTVSLIEEYENFGELMNHLTKQLLKNDDDENVWSKDGRSVVNIDKGIVYSICPLYQVEILKKVENNNVMR